MLEITAEDADRLERKRKKKNPDQGFSGVLNIVFASYLRWLFIIFWYNNFFGENTKL